MHAGIKLVIYLTILNFTNCVKMFARLRDAANSKVQTICLFCNKPVGSQDLHIGYYYNIAKNVITAFLAKFTPGDVIFLEVPCCTRYSTALAISSSHQSVVHLAVGVTMIFMCWWYTCARFLHRNEHYTGKTDHARHH